MTGLECLKAELKKQGFTEKQTESKVLLGALEIISKAPGRYSEMSSILEDIKHLEDYRRRLKNGCDAYENKIRAVKADLENIVESVNKEAEKQYETTKEYIETFYKALVECETQEAKDALRAAQMFVNSVDIDTKYDNTAFIIGLASILSRQNTAPIDTLRKINKEIPEIRVNASPGMRYGYDLKEYEIIVQGKMEGVRKAGRRV